MQKQCKVVLLGEGRVGKTSLVLRYVHNTFSDKQQPTIQASYLDKRLNIGDTSLNLAIWDTAGQERFHALGPIYYRDADAALLVYDITDHDSFEKVKNWVKELRKMVGNEIVLCIAGNKVDLDRNRQVTLAEASSYAESVGATHHNTSAKLNQGIEDVFLSMAKTLIEKKKFNQGPSRGGGSSLLITDDEPQPSKSGCC